MKYYLFLYIIIAELITSYSKKNKVTVISYMCVVLIVVFSKFFLIPKYSSELMSSFTTGQKAKNLLIAVAAYVGKVRLIDNLKLTKL